MKYLSIVANLNKNNYKGTKINRLKILEIVLKKYSKRNRQFFKCLCDCGNICEKDKYSVINGSIKSCGCLSNEREKDINRVNSSHFLYKTWYGIVERCENKNNISYKNYGGRGIVNEFYSFQYFLDCMLDSWKSGLTIDRINNNENYNKDNCKWSSVYEQNRNKSNNVFIEYNGNIITAMDLSILTGVKYTTIIARINKGLCIDDIVYVGKLRRKK